MLWIQHGWLVQCVFVGTGLVAVHSGVFDLFVCKVLGVAVIVSDLVVVVCPVNANNPALL